MTVLRHRSIEDVLSFHLSSKLGAAVMDSRAVMELISEALASDASLCLLAMRIPPRCCITKASTPSSLIVLPIGCGSRGGVRWLCFCKIGYQR